MKQGTKALVLVIGTAVGAGILAKTSPGEYNLFGQIVFPLVATLLLMGVFDIIMRGKTDKGYGIVFLACLFTAPWLGFFSIVGFAIFGTLAVIAKTEERVK